MLVWIFRASATSRLHLCVSSTPSTITWDVCPLILPSTSVCVLTHLMESDPSTIPWGRMDTTVSTRFDTSVSSAGIEGDRLPIEPEASRDCSLVSSGSKGTWRDETCTDNKAEASALDERRNAHVRSRSHKK